MRFSTRFSDTYVNPLEITNSGTRYMSAGVLAPIAFKRPFNSSNSYVLNVWGEMATDSDVEVTFKITNKSAYGFNAICVEGATLHFLAVGT